MFFSRGEEKVRMGLAYGSSKISGKQICEARLMWLCGDETPRTRVHVT